jgi:hypothetical protein
MLSTGGLPQPFFPSFPNKKVRPSGLVHRTTLFELRVDHREWNLLLLEEPLAGFQSCDDKIGLMTDDLKRLTSSTLTLSQALYAEGVYHRERVASPFPFPYLSA